MRFAMRFAMRSIYDASGRFAAGAFARFGSGGVEICERLKRSAVGFRSGDFASVGCETLRRDGANGVFTGVA